MARPRRDFVPEWARDAIWYQIFPERFCNGDPRNNPADESISGWHISPWGMDWYRQAAWEKRRGDFFASVFHRRFGGDLVGLRKKLDYLQTLGVNALYLNPVFMAPSLHKYDGSCFHHIDPSFGPDRDGDLRLLAEARESEDPATWIWTSADRYFVALLADAHRRGIRVIIDGVFNHTGRDFFAFRDLLKHGRASRYRRWYKIDHWHEDGSFQYEGWFGHQSLPEFARTKTNLAPAVRRYIFDCTRRWMDPDGDGNPADGVDGWRLDVAFCVPHGFWRAWRKYVKGINPDAYLTAEIVTVAPEWLRGDQFDAVMNYAWLFPTYAFFAPSSRTCSVARFRRQLDALRAAYPPGVSHALQNLLDSHDVARIATMLANPSSLPRNFQEYFEASRVKDRPTFDTRRPGPAVFRRLRQLVIFQMTYVGAPMIYYGTEVGMWGANDPCDRQPMLWDEIRYEAESHTPTGRCAPRSRKPDQALLAFFREAIALRKVCVALRRGALRWIPTRSSRVLAFERAHESQRIAVYINVGSRVFTQPCRDPIRTVSAGAGSFVRAGRIRLKPGGWLVLEMLDACAEPA